MSTGSSRPLRSCRAKSRHWPLDFARGERFMCGMLLSERILFIDGDLDNPVALDTDAGAHHPPVPVIGLVGGTPRLTPNPGEVAEVFSVPLDFVLDPGNHREEFFDHATGRRHYFSLQYGRHRIWGVTGNILRRFYEEVFR